ncbi:MAG: type 2 isopentenyl-diphosphate Delta-isomerase [Sulfolobales archaeon]
MSFTERRKLEHIDIVLNKNVRGPGTTWLEHVYLIHKAVPEVNYEEIDISINFLGKKLSAPIMITGMTGGHLIAKEINASLAEVAEEFRIAIGVGSQRAAIENPALADTYSIVREKAPTTIVVGNIGAAQLVKEYTVDQVIKAIEMINADAIAIHLNPAQEVIQPEGEPLYRGIINKIREIVLSIKIPIIIKETGAGLSRETVRILREAGVKIFDTSGSGGTNWVLVEMYRAEKFGNNIKEIFAKHFSNWGIPTAASIIETRYEAPESFIIGSGGLETGYDIAKAIALGADIGGVAYPALRAYYSKKLREYIDSLIREVKITLFLTGSRNLEEFVEKPIVIVNKLREWLIERGIDRDLYEIYRRNRAWKTKRFSII